MNDDPGSAREFVDRYGWTFPTIDDSDYSEVAKYGITGHPATLLVDENGGFVGGFYGEGNAEAWDALASEL